MSTSVGFYGLKVKDAQWEKMLAAKRACEAAGVPYPKELHDFFKKSGCGFSWVKESEDEIVHELLNLKVPHREMNEYGCQEIRVKVKDIPTDCEELVFYISW